MADKKTEILQNALVMFLEYDYAGTSISKLSSSVGISKSTFFNYFKNKDELFNEVFIMCKANVGELNLNLSDFINNFENYYDFHIKHANEIKFINRFEYSKHITNESIEKGISLNWNYFNDIVEGQKNGIVNNVPPIYLCLLVSHAIIQSIDCDVTDGNTDKQKLNEVKHLIERIIFKDA